ncbi:MAG: pitrilysin family protein [Anaerolineales bacterium]|jgi:zinc protease
MTKLYSETILENGLKVLLKEIHTAPLVSSWIWYRVGSRDEITGHTGISHWCEHMQFKGTPRFPSNLLERAVARDGGMWNAFTYFDWTTFFETMPTEKIDLGLRIEADRMTNSLFDEKEVASERTVVISEREGGENEPSFLLGEAVQNAAFRMHPYHHEIIGDLPDLKSMSRADLYSHYRTFYAPNNAILSVAGDFKTSEMLAIIREIYGPVPAGATPVRIERPEPAANGEHRLTVEGPGETSYLDISYHAPAASDPDFFPVTVLDSLLAGPSSLNMFGGGGTSNKTSRLYRALVENELAVSVSGGLAATSDPFLYSVVITVHPKRKPEEALAAFDHEIERIRNELIPEAEITRAIKQARALFAYGSENITNQAFWLGHAEMFARYDWFLTYLEKLAKVTPLELQNAARKYLRPQNRVVGTYVPSGAEVRG